MFHEVGAVEVKVESVVIHQDLTPKQREARKPLVAELKQRQANGEKDLIIFNRKVVLRKKESQSAGII